MDEGGADPFDSEGTIGIEEEFYLVDEAGHPADGTDELCYEHEPSGLLEGRLDHELFTFVIETQTRIIDSLESAPAELAAIREALVEYAGGFGYDVAAAGLHPTARWRDHRHVTKPRYAKQLDRIQYPQHRNITAGLHVHVGVGDRERAVWVANELRWYLPVILALSANSPFWNGYDTGLASARARIFEALPNTGMPTAFESYEAYRQLERTLIQTDSIRDRGEIWFDVRPHTEYGTVEVRTPDAHADEAVVLAIVEYVTRLTEALTDAHKRGADGDPSAHATAHPPWARPPSGGDTDSALAILEENKWRAIRYGHEAAFIDRRGEETIDLEAIVADEIDRLDLDRLGGLLEGPSGAARQRAVLEREGPEALRQSIILDD